VDPVLAAVKRGEQIVHLQRQNDIGAGNQGATAEGLVQTMVRREIGAPALVDDSAFQRFGQLHQQVHALLVPGHSIDDDNGVLGGGQQTGSLVQRAGVAMGQTERGPARDGRAASAGQRLFLQLRIDRQQHRPVGRGHGELMRPHQGLSEAAQALGLVVPFDEVAHHGGRILGGMHPFRPLALLGVQGVAAHDDDRHPVAVGVVDRHGRVLQSDGAMHHHRQRGVSGLGVAMGHGHPDLLVGDSQQLGRGVAAVIDQGLVQPAKTGGRIGGDVFDAQRLDDVGHVVGAAAVLRHRIRIDGAAFHRLVRAGYDPGGRRGRWRGRDRRRCQGRRGPERSGAQGSAGQQPASAQVGRVVLDAHFILPWN